MDAHEKNKEVLDHIDHCLNDPPISIEDSLDQALAIGRITLQEHDERMEAYTRSYKKTQELYPDE